jgi:LPXTG-motif cell wall-anchored protein
MDKVTSFVYHKTIRGSKMRKMLLFMLIFVLLSAQAMVAHAAPLTNCNQAVITESQCVLLGDLAIDKQVKVDVGDFEPADTSITAASTYIGQMVIWRITISNTQETGYGSQGYQLLVNDVIPAQFSVESVLASAGSYDSTTGVWTLPLPILGIASETLTITTKAQNSGTTIENNARISATLPVEGEVTTPFSDDNSLNDQNSAFITVKTKPDEPVVIPTNQQVLGASTLANTGDTATTKYLAGSILLSATLLVGYVGRRRYVRYYFKR